MPDGKYRVLIVHNHYQIPGGEDTVVANEKKLLEDHGHEVILYTRDNNELRTMKPWRKLLLPFTTIYNPRTARDIKRIIREERVDIVHVHNTACPSCRRSTTSACSAPGRPSIAMATSARTA